MNDCILIAAAVSNMVETLVSSSSESDDEDDNVVLLYTKHLRVQQERRPRIQNYMENVVSLYADHEFKSYFRLTRGTFNFLLSLIGNKLKKKKCITHPGIGRDTIAPEKQLLLAIWVFATPDSYRSVCDRFDVGRATAIRSVRRVIKALLQIKSQFIRWPEQNEVQYLNHRFEAKAGFPHVLGVIDGSHIKIAAPRNNPEGYINRKNFHSILLQVVCDHTHKFLDCYVGQPGSVHDQRVFRLSGLQEMCADVNNFPYDSHLIGDAAYMIQQHVLVPYKDNGRLTPRQRNFNYCLSSTRMVVENSLALLKGRFRSLLDKLPMTRTDLIPYHIMACCVLHNICILRNDLIDIPVIIEQNAREAPVELVDPILRMQGVRKRDRIAATLAMRIGIYIFFLFAKQLFNIHQSSM